MNKQSAQVATVKIAVDADGNFTYTDGSQPAGQLHVRKGQDVRWTCADGNFVVLFKGEPPFDTVSHGAEQGEFTTVAKVAKAPGQYPYSAMVITKQGTRCHDPEIIVDEGESVPPRRKRPVKKKAAPAKKATKKAAKKKR